MSTRPQPAEPARSDARGSISQELVVVHPKTGEVLDAPESETTERLAEVTVALHDAEQALKRMRVELEGELRHRYEVELAERGITHPSSKHFVVAGEYEVRLEGGNESVWDADELETAVRALVDDGTIDARDVTEVIRHETIVSRSAANSLLDRLGGPAHAAVAACRTWRRKGPGRVRVDRTTWPRELEQR